MWVVWPTANLANTNKVVPLWEKMGYLVAVLMEKGLETSETSCCAHKVLVQDTWEGFPKAVNKLCRAVPGDVVVVAGDDIHPDPTLRADEIEEQFLRHFPSTFGVMQPTGDKYSCYNTCATSPWIGRKFIEQVGPYHEGYFHYFSDEELQRVATLYLCFWQRPDLTQFHDHWERNKKPRPKYLQPALGRWQADHDLFVSRLNQRFP